jgi:hypothetical protein
MRPHRQNRQNRQNDGRGLEQPRPAPGTLGLRWFVALAEYRDIGCWFLLAPPQKWRTWFVDFFESDMTFSL